MSPHNLLAALVGLTAAAPLLVSASPALAQSTQPRQGTIAGFDARASHVVLPQVRAWSLSSTVDERRRDALPGSDALRIESVHARVDVLERVATTELEVRLVNPGRRVAEGVVLLPLPPLAAVTGFDFDGASHEPTAELLPADEARRTYDDIVRRLKDPALLEFAGYDLLRSSVFPVPAGGKQRLRITYTQVCEGDGDRVDYVLPRSESLARSVPWDIQVTLRGRASVGAIHSPTHALTEPDRPASSVGPTRVYLAPEARGEPGPFRLSWLSGPGGDSDGVQATLFAYPDPEIQGGFFLLMAGVPARFVDAESMPDREVTLVIDRSGSMRGGKLDQVKAAALQVVEGLADGERFNLIDYSSQVASFAPRPVVKDAGQIAAARAYLDGLLPTGGTNIKDALVEALRQPATPGSIPIVLFLTDGLPTVGARSELVIAQAVREANTADRRIFTFGVGVDVNAPLLDRISEDTRGLTTYIDPGHDVEVAIHSLFRRLHGPVLARPELRLVDESGQVTTRRVRELCPELLPDLYENGTMVLLGQYRGEAPLNFRLKGNFLGTEREFSFRFELDKATTRNAFVPRLWAARRIAFLVEEIRQAGAVLSAADLAGRRDLMAEGRHAELGEEILRLSTTYGVLSEYTSFLALEGSDLGDWDALLVDANRNLNDRAVLARSGEFAVNQGKNYQFQKAQPYLNATNRLWYAANERVEFSSVQQVSDRAFFYRGGTWIDARLVGTDDASTGTPEPDEVIDFGSARHRELVAAFAAEGRQAALALEGQLLLEHAGKKLLIRNDHHVEDPLVGSPPSQHQGPSFNNDNPEDSQ